MSDQFTVVTPENVELEYELAGIGSRFLALAVDTLIQMLFSAAIFSVLAQFGLSELINNTLKMRDLKSSVIAGLLVILSFAVSFLYFIILEVVMNGQTLGKKIFNIRVRKDHGNAPSFWDILLRNFIRLIDFLPFFYGIGLVVMFLNKKSKRLGDYAAGTVIIKELPRRKIKKILNQNFGLKSDGIDEAYETDHFCEYSWLNRIMTVITPQDYLMIKNLLSRQKELQNFNELSLNIIEKIRSRVAMDEPETISTGETALILKEILAQYETTYSNQS